MTKLVKVFHVCDGVGCRGCRRWGWLWSDGVVPEECPKAKGVACERSDERQQCPECPHKIKKGK